LAICVLTLYSNALTRRVAELILLILNTAIMSLGHQGQLPVTVSTLSSRYEPTDDVLFNSAKAAVSCSKCHYVDYRASPPTHCPYTMFPNHPFAPQRAPCGHPLFKINPVSKKQYAIKAFAHQDIAKVLDVFFSRPGFIDSINHWRNRASTPEGTMCDIYDGKMWTELMDN
ncbi:hypothetical protein DM01DRAFT_1266712, partial [Hesseltinella vesiculosa]